MVPRGGIGPAGAPGVRTRRSAFGKRRVRLFSRLDEGMMNEIAQLGNGRYFQATPGGSELDALLAEIDSLQRTQLESRTEVKMIERYQGFLFLAILALVLAELIPDRVHTTESRKRLSVNGKRLSVGPN